ncbi:MULTISPECIES: CDP-alcohol phosphatidyltransferase family protein [Streptomyces]|uniref:CDP-alcohol phosphatidyltransferase family protein n=1 Tax=Streptomyces solicathayae TaxID=3081768 RepID=A0ABZ0LPW6_9ACTN|nr:CDP-alcohol phosphatidyltransferase family protein [Streptomyces sp. HUAS YS2]WOX21512.1 CDP-alcohol phosphatidyltransferase family protein [Streptomyces sp. HUAS YS2]
MHKLSLRAVQKLTCKKRDAWWTVLLVDPVATRLVCWFARFNWITPNRVTWAALFVGLGSAALFLKGDYQSLAIGAALYHVSFILDCIDGKLARLKGNGSVFGGWLDYVFDRIRVLFCALALMGGQFLRTGEPIFLLAALVVVFLDMLRYVDALQIYKMRMSMRSKIEAVTLARQAEQGVSEEEQKVVFMEDLLRENPLMEADHLKAAASQPGSSEVIDLHQQFRKRFPWYARVRHALLRSRIRPHLISGIEFQMFIFIVGPLIGRVLMTTAVSAILLGAFELVIMFKFWLSTRDFTRTMERLDPDSVPSRAGNISPHLKAGRHRRREDDVDPEQAAWADERFPAPAPDEDPGFQPWPHPYADGEGRDPRDTMQLTRIPMQALYGYGRDAEQGRP